MQEQKMFSEIEVTKEVALGLGLTEEEGEKTYLLRDLCT